MKPHGEYLAWIDEAVRLLRQRIATTSLGDGSVQALDRITIESLLANRDVLVRHEENPKNVLTQLYGDKEFYTQKENACRTCHTISFPCPSYLDITTHLDKVMGD